MQIHQMAVLQDRLIKLTLLLLGQESKAQLWTGRQANGCMDHSSIGV